MNAHVAPEKRRRSACADEIASLRARRQVRANDPFGILGMAVAAARRPTFPDAPLPRRSRRAYLMQSISLAMPPGSVAWSSR
jgi:hypothetical protein